MARAILSLTRKKSLLILCGCLLISLPFINQCTSSRQSISYNKDIRPILNKKCLACHGGVRQMGEFSLLFEEEAFQPTESGKVAIIPGKAEESELYTRITHHDLDLRMPKDAQPLSETEKQLIADWINEGAKWEEHWAYISPKLEREPKISGEWMQNGIDFYIYNKLEASGLQPETEADKTSLFRRASLDLTGLPPKIEDLEAFQEDESPEAFEKAIDQLLASRHYGERWAAMWLDLARYADSKGYEADFHRNIWRYRDWVIKAFNQDLPFDQFTIEQLAGDLLPNPTSEQLIATAFHRNSMTNTEGGTSDEEFRLSTVMDRMNTSFEIWQATTLSCVQCHSHPYDPIRHEEFYQVMDIFNHSLDHDLTPENPTIYHYQAEDENRIKEIIAEIEELDKHTRVNQDSWIDDQIAEAIFPQLLPNKSQDFLHVTFGGNGVVSNWTSNLQSIGERKFYLKFDDIPMEGLESISYRFATEGADARIEVFLDSVGGQQISKTDFPNVKLNRWNASNFKSIKSPVLAKSGTHDLIFKLINTTGRIPEGMLNISLIELQYTDKHSSSTKLRELKKDLIGLRAKADETPIMQEKSSTFRRKTRFFERGNWLVQTDEMKAKVPESLLGNHKQAHNRLEFAQWLVNKENPLTARVIVNRFWEQIFGTGIIESLEDFGTQSLEASHPELLDYLALSFMHKHNWSVKSLLKEIMLSATYRQASRITPEKLEKDPYNRLLSRGPRFRLSAEQIRDQALAVSGLINDSIGGKSVMPQQPDGVWAVVYNNQQWITPEDNQKYRRGLYTYWKRTSPYPSMVSFDSPSREYCVSRRIRTNTPLQALVTLNDPVYLEAAKALAKRMEAKGKGELDEALKYGYFLALSKELDQAGLKVLRDLYQQAEKALESSSEVAVAVNDQKKNQEFQLQEPMTVVANAIMNLDGFLMKE
ncbi:MAG: DUF1553 domain-containing protein [Bacteroidia bacterium]|nr:DUF1553 domain-containing protein [Bacteroidia bacterium]